MPPPNNCKARQGEESGPRSTWGPSEAKIQAGHGVGHRVSCSINSGTDSPDAASGDMKIRAVNDLSFRKGAQIASPRENVGRQNLGPSHIICIWYFSGLWCSGVLTVLW